MGAMTASTCTLKQFMSAWFGNDRTELTEEQFQAIHLEYVDLSGLTKTKELELNAQLYSLQNRVEKVKWLLYGLRLSVTELGRPFQVGIDSLRKVGHKLYWDGDSKLFMDMLTRIEDKEKKFTAQLLEKEKEVNDFYAAKIKGGTTVTQSRQEFIKNIIELRKRGHYIIEEQTTVETFALIIKSENEEAEKQNLKYDKKH